MRGWGGPWGGGSVRAIFVVCFCLFVCVCRFVFFFLIRRSCMHAVGVVDGLIDPSHIHTHSLIYKHNQQGPDGLAWHAALWGPPIAGALLPLTEEKEGGGGGDDVTWGEFLLCFVPPDPLLPRGRQAERWVSASVWLSV